MEFPPPPYYPFLLSLALHPFMGLVTFMAGGIHQIRAQKSYLAAHTCWSSLTSADCAPFVAKNKKS